jgi:hypothetical protein
MIERAPHRSTSGFEVGEDVASLASDLGQAYDPGAPYNWIPVESGPELGPSPEPGRLNAEAVVVLGPQPDGGFIINAPLNLGVGSV